jgi:L-seryl-tRNA(Ser) seleniumtransferase
VKHAVTAALEDVRAGRIAAEHAADAAAAALPASATSMQPVLNATGVVLHTNLGRAALSDAAREALLAASGYVDVEYDTATGRRASRGRAALKALHRAVPNAGAALIVNNGAAALVLAVITFAAGREVIISRGELVEIGDGFRLPDLITSTGVRLREVGTTNRVTRDDYAAAVGPDTGCILKVHPSNFRIEGFTAAVGVRELRSLGVPLIADVGSGLLAPHPRFPGEPDLATALADGATVATGSGDKLLGGPQAGLVLGDAAAVEQMRRHPLARALRVDKLTLAAVEATIDGPVTPTWQAIEADADRLRERCAALAELIGGTVVPSDGAVGGGGAPGVRLAGWAIATPAALAEPLRRGAPPVIARVERNRCLLDLRCIREEDDPLLLKAVLAALSG